MESNTLTPPAGPMAEAGEDNTPGNPPQPQETPIMMAPELRMPNTPTTVREWNTTTTVERSAPTQGPQLPPPLPRQELGQTPAPNQGTEWIPTQGSAGEERQLPRIQPQQQQVWDRDSALAYLQSHHPETYGGLMTSSRTTLGHQNASGDGREQAEPSNRRETC